MSVWLNPPDVVSNRKCLIHEAPSPHLSSLSVPYPHAVDRCMSVLLLSSTASYDDLYKWSVVFYDKFWAEVWEYCDIIHSKTYDEVSCNRHCCTVVM